MTYEQKRNRCADQAAKEIDYEMRTFDRTTRSRNGVEWNKNYARRTNELCEAKGFISPTWRLLPWWS